ncbi:SspB-related isopeptide-forming adhesin [Streptococcus loxodontisalivarius]|uniref:SspB-related isopeptide-forming adhesin n=1 Tax=Streptococcus loxodontisalivarius TaxID=1349415 RepID=UPI003AA84018
MVKPEPQKQNLNADKVSINGQAMLVGSQNFYTLTWDLDQYQGILASQDQIAKGFYFVDDYPEEALDIDGNQIQVLTRSGEAVSGITVQTYQSLEEAPESLQAALQAKQISPKGAFQVFSPKDPVAFYQNYVQTGQTLTISNPMTVKEGLYNSGQSYQNKAYQVDFGLAYATEEVTNFVPKVKPTKTNTDGKGVVIDGKTVLPLSVTTYDITLDYSQYKDMIVTDDVLAKGFYMVDDYPEEALSILEDGIKVVDQNGNSVTGLSVKTYDSLSDAPQVVQDAFKDRKVEPKGAIQVFSAADPKSFYETYVKTGQNLKVSIPMEVKADLAKSGGQYSNTAYQIDFGIAYVTETVLNQVPKLEPEKDVVIDVSQKGQSLNGQEIALNQVFNYRLKGALIPADRASDLFEYSFKDDYDQSHDRYNGHYQVFTTVAVSLTDGTTLAEGTDVTKYTLQTLDTENGFVTIEFDSAFLSKVSAQSVFQADVYLEMERIATGQVENTFEHIVNGVTITSNTVSTYTPEVQVTVPPQEIPQSPLSETIETSKAQVLPSTGEVDNGFLALTGLGVLGLTYGLHRKRKQEGN